MNSEKKNSTTKIEQLSQHTVSGNTPKRYSWQSSTNCVYQQSSVSNWQKKMFRKLFGGHCKVCVTVKCNFCNYSFRLVLLVFNF